MRQGTRAGVSRISGSERSVGTAVSAPGRVNVSSANVGRATGAVNWLTSASRASQETALQACSLTTPTPNPYHWRKRKIKMRTCLTVMCNVLLLPGLFAAASAGAETFMPVDPVQPNTIMFEPVQARFVRVVVRQPDESTVHRRVGGLRSRPGREPGPGLRRRQGRRVVVSGGLRRSTNRTPQRRPLRQRLELDLRQRLRLGADRAAADGDDRSRRLFPRPRRPIRGPRAELARDPGLERRAEWQTVKKVAGTYVVVPEAKLLLPNRAIALEFPAGGEVCPPGDPQDQRRANPASTSWRCTARTERRTSPWPRAVPRRRPRRAWKATRSTRSNTSTTASTATTIAGFAASATGLGADRVARSGARFSRVVFSRDRDGTATGPAGDRFRDPALARRPALEAR